MHTTLSKDSLARIFPVLKSGDGIVFVLLDRIGAIASHGRCSSNNRHPTVFRRGSR
jgi:hypothetical protein